MIRRADNPVWERVYNRFWTLTLECEWCWELFRYQAKPTGGSKPHYCSDECRRNARKSNYLNDHNGRRDKAA